MDVSLVEGENLFQIEWGDDITTNHTGREARTELIDNFEDAVGKGVLECRVGPAAHRGVHLVGRIGNKKLDDMLAGGADGLVNGGGNGHLDHWSSGGSALRGLFVRFVNLLHAGFEVHRAHMLGPRSAVCVGRIAGKVGQTIHSTIDLESTTRKF